jgi:hypothetical protein
MMTSSNVYNVQPPPTSTPTEQPVYEDLSTTTPAVSPVDDFRYRVILERSELRTKIDALAAFLKTPTFSTLDNAEQGRLKTQLDIMTQYEGILAERILAFR